MAAHSASGSSTATRGRLASFGFKSTSSSGGSTSAAVSTSETDTDCSGGRSHVAKRRKWSKLTYKPEWKERFLMWPACSSSHSGEDVDDEMVCVLCNERMKAKSSTANRHQERKHPKSKAFSEGKRSRILAHYESNILKQQATMKQSMEPNQLVKLSSYKLAFILNKHKMPFSSSTAFVEFATLADPNSVVFSQMPSSRETVTRRTQDIHQRVLRPDLIGQLKNAIFWSVIVDESTDTATKEQMCMYVRFVDVDKYTVVEEFLEMKQILGHPTATTIFDAMMEVFNPDDTDRKLPLNRLASMTCDGAPVMISQKNGVAGKLKSLVNPKLFITHCPPHRLVLASKAGQKLIPDNVEKLVGDVLFFFRDSPVRREEFRKLKELVEPNSPHICLVQYHRVRWLSLADCVERLTNLLPLLVRFFEEQANDRANSAGVRSKCKTLHERLSEPLFQLYLYFIGPQLDILSTLNKWLQHCEMSLHVVNSKIRALIKAFVEPIVVDSSKDISDANRRPLEEAVACLPGKDLKKHLLDCTEHSLLTERDIKQAKGTMVAYVEAIATSLIERFPEMDFIIDNISFLDPIVRQFQKANIPSLVERFNNSDPFNFDESVLSTQYTMYRNDSSLDLSYELCQKDQVKFWCELYEGDDYKELATLAILLLSISPTSVICERGFSSMNYIKNEFRSVLSQENLNACMSIALCKHTASTFPFFRCLL